MAINLKEHQKQIKAYAGIRGQYETYASFLQQVLNRACKPAFPEVIVQTRAKSVASFAEKAARKADRYPDPVNQFTDLCGGRVIVQTLEQVKAVCRFIEDHFTIVEKDEKSDKLREDQFGYRDTHFIVQLRPGADYLGSKALDRRTIGNRKAEIQVRTWVQHAWADTLHDRIYKTTLTLPGETRRQGNLLAAIMEDGDRLFDRLADEIDGMLTNYTAHATLADVDYEIQVITAVLRNLPEKSKTGERLNLTLRLARLLITAKGDYQKAIDHLDLFDSPELNDTMLRELYTELGYALCKLHRDDFSAKGYRRGQKLLRRAVDLGEKSTGDAATDARKSRSLLARALARLAWSFECVEDGEHEALEYYRRALRCEPANPYYLASIAGFEVFIGRSSKLHAATTIAMADAIKRCREHAEAGIEMPYACFAAGRLSLLLGQGTSALEWYARGLAHCHAGEACVPGDLLEQELAFLRRIHLGEQPPPEHERVKGLLLLADAFHSGKGSSVRQAKRLASLSAGQAKGSVLVVAGAAGSLKPEDAPAVRSALFHALKAFTGTVVSGGTTSGVPGCVGAAAANLRKRKRKGFTLMGYIPATPLPDSTPDKRYDFIVEGKESGFSADQLLRNWADLLVAGIEPKDVQLLGFGGGSISSIEYRIALALGATVGLARNSGGAADALVSDPLWTHNPRLLPLPFDDSTIRAFVMPSHHAFSPKMLALMGEVFHSNYGSPPEKLLI